MANYAAYRLAAFLSQRLPIPLAYWVGLRIADLHYFFSPRTRNAVQRNLTRIFEWRGIQPSRRALRGLTRKTFQNFGKYLVDFFRYTVLTPAEVERLVSIEQLNRLIETTALGRGVIMVTAHLGNWEMGAAVLHALGYSLNAIVAPESAPRVERLLHRQRERRGLHVLHVGHSARSLLRSLQRGEVVALLADRDFSGEQDTIDFFGQPAHLPRGAAWLALQSGAPILPVFVVRLEDDTFWMRIHPPIFPDASATLASLMARIRDAMQMEIAERPAQWFVFRDFWAADPAQHA